MGSSQLALLAPSGPASFPVTNLLSLFQPTEQPFQSVQQSSAVHTIAFPVYRIANSCFLPGVTGMIDCAACLDSVGWLHWAPALTSSLPAFSSVCNYCRPVLLADCAACPICQGLIYASTPLRTIILTFVAAYLYI